MLQEPGDADVHAALGVLHSLGRQFERAGDAFRSALALRPKVGVSSAPIYSLLVDESSDLSCSVVHRRSEDSPEIIALWSPFNYLLAGNACSAHRAARLRCGAPACVRAVRSACHALRSSPMGHGVT